VRRVAAFEIMGDLCEAAVLKFMVNSEQFQRARLKVESWRIS
jgi:hypothetical protein